MTSYPELLVHMMESEGFEFKSALEREECIRSIEEAVEKDQLKVLFDLHNEPCGFFTWEVHNEDGKTSIFLNNMFVFPYQRGQFRFIVLRKFFKSAYGDIKRFWWNNRKTKKDRSFPCLN